MCQFVRGGCLHAQGRVRIDNTRARVYVWSEHNFSYFVGFVDLYPKTGSSSRFVSDWSFLLKTEKCR